MTQLCSADIGPPAGNSSSYSWQRSVLHNLSIYILQLLCAPHHMNSITLHLRGLHNSRDCYGRLPLQPSASPVAPPAIPPFNAADQARLQLSHKWLTHPYQQIPVCCDKITTILQTTFSLLTILLLPQSLGNAADKCVHAAKHGKTLHTQRQDFKQIPSYHSAQVASDCDCQPMNQSDYLC